MLNLSVPVRTQASERVYLKPGKYNLSVKTCRFIERTASGSPCFACDLVVDEVLESTPESPAAGTVVSWVNMPIKIPDMQRALIRWNEDNVKFAAAVLGMDLTTDKGQADLAEAQKTGELEKIFMKAVDEGVQAFAGCSVFADVSYRTTRKGSTFSVYSWGVAK